MSEERKPYLSVIMPCYNVSKYIRKCFDSIFLNDVSDIEFVIVNDGATDETPELIKSYFGEQRTDCGFYWTIYKGAYVRYLEKENGGLSSARNFGLDHATGEYVTTLDPDDFVANDYFATMKAEIKKDHADLYLFGFEWWDIDEKERLLFRRTHFPIKNYCLNSNEEVFNEMFPRIFGYSVDQVIAKHKTGAYVPEHETASVWRFFYKREIIEQNQIRFDENLSLFEDWIFNANVLLYVNSMRTVMRCFYNYMVRPSGLYKKIGSGPLVDNQTECLHERARIAALARDKGYDVGIKDYAGSVYEGICRIISNADTKYWKKIDNYLSLPDVKESLRLLPSTGPIGYTVRIFLLRHGMDRVLFDLIKIKQKFWR